MTRRDKLMADALAKPQGIRFEDACRIACALGFVHEGGRGSHRVFKRPSEPVQRSFKNRCGSIPPIREIGVPPQRISEIVAGKRAITADTDLRLCRFFGLSSGYWLRAQVAHDTEVAQEALAAVLEQIKPWNVSAA